MKKILLPLLLLASCGIDKSEHWRFIAINGASGAYRVRQVTDTSFEIWALDPTRPIIDTATGKQRTDTLGNKYFYQSWQPISKDAVGVILK